MPPVRWATDLIKNELSSGWAAATALVGAVVIAGFIDDPVLIALASVVLATVFLGVQGLRHPNASYHVDLDVEPSAGGVVLICESRHDHGNCFSVVEATVVDPLGFRHRAADLSLNRFDRDWQVYLPFPRAFDLSERTRLIRPGEHRVAWRGQFRGSDKWMSFGTTSFRLTEGVRIIKGAKQLSE